MITVVIATYNEASNIKELLDQLTEYEVIIVDDNSPDGTGDIARIYTNVRVLTPKTRLGIAKSYRAGFTAALKGNPEFVIQMDAGLTHNPKDIPEMINLAKRGNYKLVYGSRFYTGIKFNGYRTLISLGARFLMKLIGVKMSDATCGFRCWNPTALRNIISMPWISKGFSFQLEAAQFTSVLYGNFQIEDYPIEYKLTNSSFNFKLVIEALRVYLHLLRRRYAR